MDESSEIKFLKAKVALLETEKKHEAPRNILSPAVNVTIIHEENQPDYPIEQKISLSEERRLISKAQKGSKKSRDELVLRHINFLSFRIRRIAFPYLVQRLGDDLLGEAILIVYKKIESYDLNYRDKEGNSHPVKFISYIWKRIDGFIIDYLKEEIKNIKARYAMSGQIEVDKSIY
jgi:DNA-directed RNA polymerase specialized sigma subunit